MNIPEPEQSFLATQVGIYPHSAHRYDNVERSTMLDPYQGQGIEYGFVATVDALKSGDKGLEMWGIRIGNLVDPAGEASSRDAPDRTVGERGQHIGSIEKDSVSISQRVDMNSQRVDLLMGDRMTLQETVWMVEEEAYASREAWLAHQTQLQLQSTLIQTQKGTRVRASCTQNSLFRCSMLKLSSACERLMAELLALREQQRRARQPGPEARIPDHQEASRDADSHI
ncbi:hypothetical protein Tco_1394855 [Tanacetum coccineum]